MQGRIALVTGGGGGIGEATARVFAEEGAAVALVDVNANAADEAAAGIAGDVRGAHLLPLGGNLAREAEAQRAYPILFLACAASSFVTGTALPVDAGKHVI